MSAHVSSPSACQLPTNRQDDSGCGDTADATDRSMVERLLKDELYAIVYLLEADRVCSKPSGYVKEARMRLKRVLADLAS